MRFYTLCTFVCLLLVFLLTIDNSNQRLTRIMIHLLSFIHFFFILAMIVNHFISVLKFAIIKQKFRLLSIILFVDLKVKFFDIPNVFRNFHFLQSFILVVDFFIFPTPNKGILSSFLKMIKHQTKVCCVNFSWTALKVISRLFLRNKH